MSNLEHYFGDFVFAGEEDMASLVATESHYGRRFIDDYRDFMATHDGGERAIGDAYLVLWRASEIVQYNIEYEFDKYAPGIVSFGSNGSGEGFAFDLRSREMQIVVVPFIGMSHESVIGVSSTFEGFLRRMKHGNIFSQE